MKNIEQMANYAMSLYCQKMYDYKRCMLEAVKYYNCGQYDHDLMRQLAKYLADNRVTKNQGRKKQSSDSRQLSLF